MHEPSYDRYIQSDRWARKRQEYRDSGRPVTCAKCGSKVVQYHHRTYKRFTKELLDDLVPLCQRHHSALHDYQRQHALTVEQATTEYLGGKVRKPKAPPKPRAQRLTYEQKQARKAAKASKANAQRDAIRRDRLGLPPLTPIHHEPHKDASGAIRSSGTMKPRKPSAGRRRSRRMGPDPR